MSSNTTIEWADATWNPLRVRKKTTGKIGQHCERVSEGCRSCYAATWNRRNLPNGGTGLDYTRGSRDVVEPFVDERVLTQPLRWREPRRIFVENQSDVFGEWFTDEQRDRVFAVMALAPRHTFQVLTKRPERMREYLRTRNAELILANEAHAEGARGAGTPTDRIGHYARARIADRRAREATGAPPREDIDWPLPNVHLGVSVEDQKTADARIPVLLDTSAALRWISLEPMLGPVRLDRDSAGIAADRDWLQRRTRHHLQGDVVGMLRNRSFSGLQHSDGREMSRDDARRELERLRDSGVKFIPVGDCDGFDPNSGCPSHRVPTLDWVVVGGESGPRARPSDVAWIRLIVEQCKAAGVPCFVKQLGAHVQCANDQVSDWLDECSISLHDVDVPAAHYQGAPVRVHLASRKGSDPSEWPEDLRVRELPGGAA